MTGQLWVPAPGWHGGAAEKARPSLHVCRGRGPSVLPLTPTRPNPTKGSAARCPGRPRHPHPVAGQGPPCTPTPFPGQSQRLLRGGVTGTGRLGPTLRGHAGTLFPLQYMASRQSRWKAWLHLVRQPTAAGPTALLAVTSLYPDAADSFSMQMMQSWRGPNTGALTKGDTAWEEETRRKNLHLLACQRYSQSQSNSHLSQRMRTQTGHWVTGTCAPGLTAVGGVTAA